MKLSGFISEKLDINKGTEQGHPLSPDLFKIYIRDLSPELAGIDRDVPVPGLAIMSYPGPGQVTFFHPGPGQMLIYDPGPG